MEIGTPVPTMGPVYGEGLEQVIELHGGKTVAEIKHDGYRLQAHVKNGKVLMFSRNLKDMDTRLYPEIVSSLSRLPDSIIDAELIGQDVGINGFNMIKKRFRPRKMKPKSLDKYLKSGVIEDNPLELRVFDCLLFEGKPLVDKPLSSRHKTIELFSQKNMYPVLQNVVNSSEELQALFDDVIGKGHEGLVCKRIDSIYLVGQKTTDWIKLKKFDTIDLVVLGVYDNDRDYARDLPFANVLVGSYNDLTGLYETLGKVSVVREDIANHIAPYVKDKLQYEVPGNLIVKDKDKLPQWFIRPEESIVLEIKAMNINNSRNWHSCGLSDDGRSYSLRIAWTSGLRLDKTPVQATTTAQIAKMYNMQQS